MANEVKYRPATMAEVEGRDVDLYMNGERVYVMMIMRSETIGEDSEPKLDYIWLTNMKKVQLEDLQVIDDTLKEQDELPESPMMKQYRDLKRKHKNAILLFRCGDFYETYEDDAKECAKVLGITLTKRQSDGVAMAGFPHHALDTYLPKLVRAANSGQMKFKRIAICDQLDPPPGPRPKRGENIDKAAIKREQSDACIDSAEREQAQTKFNSSNNNQNSEDKVMTNETVKVADLIGKSISNGGNAKYTINAIEGDKVNVTFQMGDSEGKSMTMGVAQVEKLLQGGWQVSDGTQEPTEQEADGGSQKAEEPKAKTVKMTSEREQSGTRSGSAERESSRPQGKMKPEPKPKQEQPAKPRKKQPQTEAKAEEPKPEHKTGKLVYSAYTNKKGKACAKISGFAETDAAYQKEAAASLHGSASYETLKGERVNFLTFGPRYAEVAKTVCQMLNEGRTVADCQAVVDAATEERAAKREERKQKREAYRQEREGKAQTAKPQGKVYTEAEVADLMRRVIAGDKEAMAIVNAMAA